MSNVTIEIPDNMRDFVERQVNDGEYSSVADYCLSLIRNDARLQEIETLMDEAEDDFEQGRVRVHQKGDIVKMGEELIRQRLEAKRK